MINEIILGVLLVVTLVLLVMLVRFYQAIQNNPELAPPKEPEPVEETEEEPPV